MKRKLIITELNKHLFSACYENDDLIELSVLDSEDTTLLGNIYIGRVKNIVQNLQAAFVEISPGVLCYYSITENQHIFLNSKNTEKVCNGDEILVQVNKEGIKSKAPSVTAHLTLHGMHTVVTLDSGMVGISNKLPRDERTEGLKQQIKNILPDGYGAIIRTSAYEAEDKVILDELQVLLEQLQEIIETARYRKQYQCMYQQAKPYISLIQDYNDLSLEQIITDQNYVYEDILKQLGTQITEKLIYYEDDRVSLVALHNLERELEKAIQKKVWLRSGGYLVIEQTEAMVVIDVNSGKAIHKKNREQHFLQLNIEAAQEIARQIRLRNLSGIIMIDFIDMECIENKQELIDTLCQFIKKDRNRTNFIEMTRLQLIELTRKKVRKSLQEQLKDIE